MTREYPTRVRGRACWDCHCPMPEGAPALCQSCEMHRKDGHEPVVTVLLEVMDSNGQWRASREPIREWCHGAGHNGQNESLLNMPPRAMYVEQYGSAKNPHTRRVIEAA